jgi:hypothetical protein
MTKSTLSHKVRTTTAIAALFLISWVCTPLAAQNSTSAERSPSIAPTLPLGEPIRTAKLESDDPDTKYQNGFFFNFKGLGHILIRDKDGHIIGDSNLRPLETSKVLNNIPHMHDAAVFKDGSVVASWIYTLPHDPNSHFNLVHYDRSGNILEQIDLGRWRALAVCIADDKSIWTLSGEEEMGHSLYSPGEGVLRNYKFGSGLLRAVVPRSNFAQDWTNAYATGVHAAIDCSGNKIHVLSGDGQWIEYTPGADFTITPVESFSHATYGDFWRMIGFAYLDNGHAYAVIHSVPGDPFRRMLAELLPSPDGKTLRWVEVPPDKILPANNQSPDQSADHPKEPVAITGILGVDHEGGEQLVYRTSKDETILWSKPLFGSSGSH